MRNVNEKEIMVGAGIWREVRGSEYEMQTVCLYVLMSAARFMKTEKLAMLLTLGEEPSIKTYHRKNKKLPPKSNL